MTWPSFSEWLHSLWAGVLWKHVACYLGSPSSCHPFAMGGVLIGNDGRNWSHGLEVRSTVYSSGMPGLESQHPHSKLSVTQILGDPNALFLPLCTLHAPGTQTYM